MDKPKQVHQYHSLITTVVTLVPVHVQSRPLRKTPRSLGEVTETRTFDYWFRSVLWRGVAGPVPHRSPRPLRDPCVRVLSPVSPTPRKNGGRVLPGGKASPPSRTVHCVVLTLHLPCPRGESFSCLPSVGVSHCTGTDPWRLQSGFSTLDPVPREVGRVPC